MNLLEQSERPAGPWVVMYEQVTELRDLERSGRRRTVSSRSIVSGADWSKPLTTISVSGTVAIEVRGNLLPGPGFLQEDEEDLRLAAERVLITASAAPDLAFEGDAVLQDVRHHVVVFTLDGNRCRLFLNADTNLPTAIERTSEEPYGMFSIWGDVTTRVYFSTWMLEPGGLRYPHQVDVERNGLPYRTTTITKLTLNPPVPQGSFDIPSNVQEAYKKSRIRFGDVTLGFRARRAAAEIAKDVVEIPGSWNVTLIRQSDGVVIIEAPISSGYTSQVISEAGRRFPGVPVKAVISTSDAWPHFGGIREYVARGIPIYGLDLNKPLLERLIAAPHRLTPDALAHAPRKPILSLVSGKTVLGTGANRIELYPIRSESGERMLMVYFPEHRLLYGADLIQRMPDGSFFMPQYLSELAEAVQREKLQVDTVFAIHYAAGAWREIIEAIAKASATEAPKDH